MVKPKNPRLVFGKPLNPKAVTSIKRKSRSPFLKIFRLNPKNKIIMLVGQNIQNTQHLLQDSNSMIGIGNWIIFLIQCCFHHIGHLYLCHADLITACLVFIRHGIIIHVCGLFLDICVQIILPIGSWQLVNHHISLMTILMKKIGLYRKRNTRWSSKFIVSKRWTIKQKFRFDTR